MGSGKTATGSALAELLGWEFVDLDEEIERKQQVPIRRLFWERGEKAFRSIEHDTLGACLVRTSKPTVVALGGGAFVQANNVDLLRASAVRTIFLETPVEEMLTRCGIEEKPDPENPRPLATDAAAFRKLYEQRLPAYRAAHLTIDTTGKTIGNIAREITDSLKLTSVR